MSLGGVLRSFQGVGLGPGSQEVKQSQSGVAELFLYSDIGDNKQEIAGCNRR